MSGAGEEKQEQEKKNWKQELAREGRIGAALIEDNGFLSQEVLSIASKRAEQERMREGCWRTRCNTQLLYPCSTKTREELGNPSTTPKRFPET